MTIRSAPDQSALRVSAEEQQTGRAGPARRSPAAAACALDHRAAGGLEARAPTGGRRRRLRRAAVRCSRGCGSLPGPVGIAAGHGGSRFLAMGADCAPIAPGRVQVGLVARVPARPALPGPPPRPDPGEHHGQADQARCPRRRRRQPEQAPRVRLPVQSEIYGGTRSAWDYGPLGVELKENIRRQWWQSMVQRPRRRRRAGLRGDPGPAGLGGLRARRRVRRPADRVPAAATSASAPTTCSRRTRTSTAGRRRTAWPTSSARTAAREGSSPSRATSTACCAPTSARSRTPVRAALPAPGDRAGHLRQLRNVAEHLAQEAAVRHRPDRQELPQRDHPGQLHLPHPRVRADGDGVLRQARHRRGVARVLAAGALGLVPRPRAVHATTCAVRAPEGEAVPLLQAHRRHRVPLPLRRQRVRRAGGHRQPHRLRPHAPTASTPASTCRYFDQETSERWMPVRHRAGGRPDPRHAGVPARRLRRGRGAQRQGRRGQAHGAAPRPAARAGQGRGAAAVAQRRPVAEGQGPGRRAAAQPGTSTSTTPAPSAAATAARTRSARRSASPSTSTPSTTRPSPCATATPWRRSASRSAGLRGWLAERLPGC